VGPCCDESRASTSWEAHLDSFIASPEGVAVTNIGLNLVSSALWSLMTRMGRRAVPASARNVLSDSIRSAEDAISKALESVAPRDVERIRVFLASPEAEEILRQVYVIHYIPDQLSHLSTIEAEFRSALALQLGESPHDIADFAEIVFKALTTACQEALQIACETGSLAAHDALATARHRILQDQLDNI
jgi:hypothetical protein